MPRRGGHLTPQEKVFVKHMAETGNAPFAGYKAGLVDPDKSASRVAARPAVAEAVRAQQAKHIENRLLPKAVMALEKILDDAVSKEPQMTAKTHVEGIKITMSYSLGRNAEAADKAPEDMTPAELAARIVELRARQLKAFDDMPEAEVIEQEPAQDGGIFG